MHHGKVATRGLCGTLCPSWFMVSSEHRETEPLPRGIKTPLCDTTPGRLAHPANGKAHSERNPGWR